MINSGTSVKTNTEIGIAHGGWIDKGTNAMVLGVVRTTAPAVYLLMTQDEFEPEEFFCYADNFDVVEREVA